MQSVLHPNGEGAGRIAEISWVMFIGAGIIFLLVMILLTLVLYGTPRAKRRLGRRSLVVAAGLAFPVAVLSALLAYNLKAASSLIGADEPPAVRIAVIGEMWWWRVQYLDADGQLLFETANDIRIPYGLPVEFVLRSDNVIHSFWVPRLAGKLDMIPGHVNRLRVQASEAGLFRGQCAEYCGAQHAKMMFDVQALSPAGFQRWMTAQRQPAREPASASLYPGRRLFMQACAQCHTIRGTRAAGTLGPDLTHIGSRRSVAAGVLPNNIGTLAGWIADSQHIKPGNQMPSFKHLSGQDLRALAQYLESLE
ncbi:c-type cytochrome [Pollutimonas sp. H1-120]|uniref:cytochrome c oxidase subunit II n=1 Tax=Pollutimonas sp. H1-120 TaxID=3148824 RepID=UPI003B52ABE3